MGDFFFFRNIMQGCGVYSPIWTRKDSRLQVVNRKTIWDLFKPAVSSIAMPSASMHGCWFYYWLSGLAFMARLRVRRESEFCYVCSLKSHEGTISRTT